MAANERQWSTPEGSLSYVIEGEGDNFITITGYSGLDAEVRIPERIEGFPVRVIRKKTFLSRKQLKRVALPETIEEIGDWAFTYCTNLESVWLPKKEMKLGSRIFMECPGIRKLYAGNAGDGSSEKCRKSDDSAAAEETAVREQTAALLAAGTVLLDAEYLLNPLEAGSDAWLQKWDARMEAVMHLEDSDGYTKMILCGEEDYGSSIEEFIANKRKAKVRLALLRLMNPMGLKEKAAEEWKNYIVTHTKGCETEEAWEVMLVEHGHEQDYFRLFAEIGGVNEDNFDALLKDMQGEYAEMKAFLIRYKAEEMESGDFFDELSLDD